LPQGLRSACFGAPPAATGERHRGSRPRQNHSIALEGDIMIVHRFRLVALALGLAALAADPALAHHMMGGRTPSTFAEGVLSGLGHPVIGIDHLAFLVAVGLAVGIARLSIWTPAAFVAASALGVALHVAGVNVPAAEIFVAASVILAGAVIARGLTLGTLGWASLFAVAGLFHGYAYGESIYGAEATPLWAYLLGLVVIQSVLACGIAAAIARYQAGTLGLMPRLVGACVAGVGLAVLAQQLVPAG
jgi:urease accessory protein